MSQDKRLLDEAYGWLIVGEFKAEDAVVVTKLLDRIVDYRSSIESKESTDENLTIPAFLRKWPDPPARAAESGEKAEVRPGRCTDRGWCDDEYACMKARRCLHATDEEEAEYRAQCKAARGDVKSAG